MRLIVEGLVCVRGGRRVFRGLSCTVGAGEALVVTGPNGSGKTSFLRLVAGLLRPAAGSIRLEGQASNAPIAGAVHFVGHLDGTKSAFSAAENLAFARDLAGGGGDDVPSALTRLGLASLASFPARELSAGQRRRLALARLLVAPRPLWLVDEPTAALDAEGQATFQALAERHLSGGGMLVATTHAPLQFSKSHNIDVGEQR